MDDISDRSDEILNKMSKRGHSYIAYIRFKGNPSLNSVYIKGVYQDLGQPILYYDNGEKIFSAPFSSISGLRITEEMDKSIMTNQEREALESIHKYDI